MERAFGSENLVIAFASSSLVFSQFPLLKPPNCNVLPQEHVEGRVDMFEHIVADKDDGVEALEDHTDFGSGVPSVVAPHRKVRGFETMSSAAAHGVQEFGTISAE